jgi:hypothetical protein
VCAGGCEADSLGAKLSLLPRCGSGGQCGRAVRGTIVFRTDVDSGSPNRCAGPVAWVRKLGNEPITWLVLGLVGAAAAVGLTFGDKLWSDWSAEAQRFAGQPESLLWFGAVVLQFVLWVTLQAPMWSMAQRVKAGERWAQSSVGLVIVCATVAGVVYVASTLELAYPLPHHELKLLILTPFGLLAVVPGVLTIWRVQRLAGALEADVGTAGWEKRVGGERHPVKALRDLRDRLDSSLFLLGLILGAAVVSAALFRLAIIAWYPPVAEGEDPVIAKAYVIIYGAAFSVLLIALYSVARARVVAVCRKAVDALVPIDQDSTDVGDRLDKRAKLEKELKLDIPLGTSLNAGIGILAPIATSLLGLVDLS